MADFDPFNFNVGGLTSAASGFVDWLVIIFIFGLVAGLLWLCLYLLSFKYPIRIRQQTGAGWVIIDTKAREFITREDKVRKWRFLKWIRNSYTAPPNDYLEFTRKGKFSAECVRTTDGSVTWTKRNPNSGDVDSFTGEERVITGTEMRRANEYIKKGWGEKLFQLAPVFICVIIVVLLLAFWGDFVKTSSDAAVQNAKSSESLRIGTEKLVEALDVCYGVSNLTKPNIVVDNKGKDLPPIPN